MLAREADDLGSAYAPPGVLFVIVVDGQAAGCVGLRSMDTHRAAIQRLYVRPAHQGVGLGQALLDACVEHARSAGFASVVLDVLPSRTKVVDWYRRRGFTEIEPYEELPVPMTFLQLSVNS